VKDIGRFYKNKECEDGHVNICKNCRSLYWANRYPLRKERVKEYGKIWRMNKPGRVKEIYIRWLNKNREEEKLRSRKWKLNNKTSCQKSFKIWVGENRNYFHSRRYKEWKNAYMHKNIAKIGGVVYNKNSVSNELRPLIETLIMLRNKKNLYRRMQDGE